VREMRVEIEKLREKLQAAATKEQERDRERSRERSQTALLQRSIAPIKADCTCTTVARNAQEEHARATPPWERPVLPSRSRVEQGVNFLLGSAGARVSGVDLGGGVGGWREVADLALYRHMGVALLGNAAKNPPHMALDPRNDPGRCWCFRGSAANLTVSALQPFLPHSFFVSHIPREYYTKVKVDTAAPRAMRVHLEDVRGVSRVAGSFEYRLAEQDRLGLRQHFTLAAASKEIPRVRISSVKLEILSSHGTGSAYTCLYQFGGYGE